MGGAEVNEHSRFKRCVVHGTAQLTGLSQTGTWGDVPTVYGHMMLQLGAATLSVVFTRSSRTSANERLYM